MTDAYIKVQEGEKVVTYHLEPDARYKIYVDQEPIVRVWDKKSTRLLAMRYVVMLCLCNQRANK